MKPGGSKSSDGPQRKRRAPKLGKLRGDQSQIHIPVGKHKWKALRELKKARIEAGVYKEVREIRDTDKNKTDLLKKGKTQSEKVR